MSSALFPRLAVRQSRLAIQRRAQSSTSEAASSTANKAKEGAAETASKAQQGLSRVSSSAGSALTSAATSAGNALSGIGGRTGAVISWAQGMIPPTVYYARVVGELGKIIYRGRGMAPPTMQTVQTYLQPVRNAMSNPSSLMATTQQTAQSAAQSAANSPQTFLARIRNMDRQTMTSAAVIGAETIGFFCVGEMLGRFKIVGYRGGNHGEHH